ncbi:MAG: adenosine deaminase [Myxococcota bacterium]|nr:adenosine deaminase [Myxococcota bacterium]
MTKRDDHIEITAEFLQAIPKADLHCHLDGSLRVDTILDLAKRQGIRLPADSHDGIREAVHAGRNCDDLVDYLKAFDITCKVLQTEEALHRVAFELAEDAAAENVRYLEVRYAPILHTVRGLRLDQIVEAVIDGLHAAEQRYDIKTGLIICGIRNMTPETSLRVAELAVAFKNRGVVGFDLAGAEYNNPAKLHRDAFYLIRNNNINVTIHAGEAYGPESIHQAIHHCGSHRIGHGTRLKENGDLLNFVNDHRIPLEICLKSNIQTRAVPSLASHPFRFYLDLGLRVTLNTDNRLITDTTVSEEYLLAQQQWDLGLDEIRWIMVNGFKSAFLPFREKKHLLRRAIQQFDEIVAKGSRKGARSEGGGEAAGTNAEA